jgi:hypothetical protein
MSFSRVEHSCAQAVAGQAIAPAGCGVFRVLRRDLVSPLAVGSRPLPGHGSSPRLRGLDAPLRGHVGVVLGFRPEEKMIRPAASPHVATVEHAKIARVLAGFEPPHKPRYPVRGSAAYADVPITATDGGAGPKPAAGAFGDFRPEAFGERVTIAREGHRLSGCHGPGPDRAEARAGAVLQHRFGSPSSSTPAGRG